MATKNWKETEALKTKTKIKSDVNGLKSVTHEKQSFHDLRVLNKRLFVPLFQNESKCETILMKMTLTCMKNKCRTRFHGKGFAQTRFETETKGDSVILFWLI